MILDKKVDNPGTPDGLGTATELTKIKPKTLKLLQEQIDHEFFAERLYLSLAVWLDNAGYPETAKFFSAHAHEERGHAMDFINFMLKRGEKVDMPGTKDPPRDFTEEEVFTAAIDHEKFITQKIADIYATALEEGDIMALELARKYTVEQIEEEQLFLSLYNLYKLEGSIGVDMEAQMGDYTSKSKHILGNL